jgi:hypothetical protein
VVQWLPHYLKWYFYAFQPAKRRRQTPRREMTSAQSAPQNHGVIDR